MPESFRMIRCGHGYGLVIMISPADATPETKDVTFYRYAHWIEPNGFRKPRVFVEIAQDLAISYFSGQADACGSAPVPKNVFPSLKAAIRFLKSKWMEAAVEMLQMVRLCKDRQRGASLLETLSKTEK